MQTSEENLRFSFLYFTCKLNMSLSFEKEQLEDITCDLIHPLDCEQVRATFQYFCNILRTIENSNVVKLYEVSNLLN